MLKEVGSSSRCKTKPNNIGLNIDNEVCFDKLKVAEHFNDYFTSIASSLVEKLPTCSGRFGQAYVADFYRNQNVLENMFGLVNTLYNRCLRY